MRNPRKPIAMLIMLAYLALWVWGAASVGAAIDGAPAWAELIYYVAAGTLWVLPLRPLFRWMNAAQPPEEE